MSKAEMALRATAETAAWQTEPAETARTAQVEENNKQIEAEMKDSRPSSPAAKKEIPSPEPAVVQPAQLPV